MAVLTRAQEEPVEISGNSETILAEARSWLGTPWRHAAAVKGLRGGVDCAMLLARVYVDAGMVADFDPRPYSMQYFLHRSEPRYQTWVEKYARKVTSALPGDVALFQFGRSLSHGGIYLGEDRIIHAWRVAGAVVETEMMACPQLETRLGGFWRVGA